MHSVVVRFCMNMTWPESH